MFNVKRIAGLALPVSLLLLAGCFGGQSKPFARSVDLERSSDSILENLVLKKDVFLIRGIQKRVLYGAEQYVDTTSTSKFGKEDQVADVGCAVSGLTDVLPDIRLVATQDFWQEFGAGKNELALASLFDKVDAATSKGLQLDYLVVVYNQRLNLEYQFMEGLVEGFVKDKDREDAASVTIDVGNRTILGATEVSFHHLRMAGHAVGIIPLGRFEYPENDLCHLVGMRAGEAILASTNQTKKPRVAVVAGEWARAEVRYR